MTQQLISELKALAAEYGKRTEAHYRLGIIDIEQIPVDNVRDFAWWSYGVECGLLKALSMVRESVGEDMLGEGKGDGNGADAEPAR